MPVGQQNGPGTGSGQRLAGDFFLRTTGDLPGGRKAGRNVDYLQQKPGTVPDAVMDPPGRSGHRGRRSELAWHPGDAVYCHTAAGSPGSER
ncbi:hypothetical protein D3C75_1127370 [compost metagenome]